MNETFFITGATGFIGRRLARRLVESGKRARCLARSTSRREELAALGVEFVDGDLNDLDALRRGAEGCAGVFHAAGLTRELRKGDFMAVNCVGTRNVAQACVDAGTPRLVAVSSLAGAGIAPKASSDAPNDEATYAPYRLRREFDLPKPISPYGKSKLASERALLEFADKLEITVLRPPYVFGEGDLLSLELFKMAKQKGIMVLPGYIDCYYSFVYVDDLVEIMVAAAERGERLDQNSLTPDATGSRCSGKGVYFPAGPTNLRFSEFGLAIGRAFGRKKIATIKIPPMGVLGTGVYGEIYKAVTHKYAALDWNKAVEAVRGPWICSGEKAIRELGVSIEPGLDEKIAIAARWYESAGLL
ncbi:MAG: NAD-dependent epimerase/dehydratase family protein [Thermoguttaceae bacterium]|nr:NAD-dependent epimerase/dehydratase family protein [Thermoguttaceae bacterium]